MRFLTICRIQPNSEKFSSRETHFITSQLGESPHDINERSLFYFFAKCQKN